MNSTKPIGAALLTTAVLLAAALSGTRAAAQPSVEDGFEPLIPRVADRPASLIETDYYVYGPGTAFTAPELSLTIQDNDFSQPVTLYVYQHNRLNGNRQFANVELGLTPSEVDLFGDVGSPRRIMVASLEEFKLFGVDSALGTALRDLDDPTGRYQFVLELRDQNGENVIARSNSFYSHVDAAVTVSGESTGETWSADNAYFLDDRLTVTEGVLKIPAGTVVLGGSDGAIVIEQGARIEAIGEPLDPIIFSSDFAAGSRDPGDWGGLIINGEAPTNQGVDPLPEGVADSGPYGGNEEDDSSGALSYARIEYAGIANGRDLNGLTLQGVGRGTRIDHVQVHLGLNDGVEIRGGTVDAKFIYVSGAEKDSLDWREGWKGRLQFFVANQCSSEAHGNGFNGSNDSENEEASPVSNPTIRNVTLIGDGGLGRSDNGQRLQEGTKADINNSVMFEFSGLGIVVDESSAAFLSGMGITVDNTILFGNVEGETNKELEDFGSNMITADPRFLNNPRGRRGCGVTPDLTFTNNVGAGGEFIGAFFERAPYIGAIEPEDPWTNMGFLAFSDD